jgi:hypothetical protein
LEESVLLGADYFGLVASTEDLREGTTSFLEKTNPSFGDINPASFDVRSNQPDKAGPRAANGVGKMARFAEFGRNISYHPRRERWPDKACSV